MKVKFISLASGSSGNCYYLGTETYGILIDAGIGIRTIKKSLKDYNILMDSIRAVFITHDHADHIKAVGNLGEKMNIPVFHDDQHGTAIVVCAALVNALKLAEKQNPTIVINGAGSAGVAIATLILKIGLGNVILVDKQGILTADMDLTSGQRGLIDKLNKEGKTGSLKDALVGADVFIGVSAGHIVSKEMIASMNEKAIVFPMANPVPEIEPEDAKEA